MKNLTIYSIFFCFFLMDQTYATENLTVSTSSGLGELPGLNFALTKEKKTATVGVSKVINNMAFGLSLKGSLDDDKATFANADGLNNDVKLTTSFTYIWLEGVNLSTSIDESLRKRFNEAQNKVKDCQNNCSHLKAELESIRAQIAQPREVFRDAWFIRADTSYLKQSFDYFSLEENKLVDNDKEGFEISAAFGRWLSPFSRFEAGLKFQSGYAYSSDNKTRNICRTLPENTVFDECFNTHLLASIKKENLIPFARYQKHFDSSNIIKAASFELKYLKEKKAQRDNIEIVQENRFIAESLIELFRTEKHDLTAGVKLTWQNNVSENEDPLLIGLYINTPINIY